VVPPVHFDLSSLFSGRIAPADALRYSDKAPTRIIVVRKDGTGAPVVLEQPACVVFHHGNLVENGAVLQFDSMMSPDDSILRFIAEWTAEHPAKPRPTQLTRISLDLQAGRVISRQVLGEGDEFPRFDARLAGRPARHLFTLRNGDGFALRWLHRHDFTSGRTQRVDAGPGHAFGEAVFVPRTGARAEEEGWLLCQGFSAERNETYLDVRDAATLERASRIWIGQHFPIGLHGNFYPES
jgi:carotenoid cleavage dioxygenase-like enzyme